MFKDKKFCITFAGAVGSSKTPISNYLSTKLALPVFNNDAIRSEVVEDLGVFNSDEHIKRRNLRLREIAESGISFICDASVDREWEGFKKQLQNSGYKCFIISLDLDKDFLKNLYNIKGYFESLKQIDEWINDHNIFLEKYSNDVALHITENDFKQRLEKSYEKVKEWLVIIRE